jgi:hypothetical protein
VEQNIQAVAKQRAKNSLYGFGFGCFALAGIALARPQYAKIAVVLAVVGTVLVVPLIVVNGANTWRLRGSYRSFNKFVYITLASAFRAINTTKSASNTATALNPFQSFASKRSNASFALDAAVDALSANQDTQTMRQGERVEYMFASLSQNQPTQNVQQT